MKEKTVMDALVQMKRTGNLLNELTDLTRQLGESIDRNDQVSIQMLIAMREEPLGKLQAADKALREQLEALDDREEAEQLAAILNGGSAGDGGQTVKMLCDQVALNRRRLKQVMDLDRSGQKPEGRPVVPGGGQLIQYELGIPGLEAPLQAVGVGDQHVSAEGHAPDENEVAAGGEVSFAHQGHQHVLRMQGPAQLVGSAPGEGRRLQAEVLGDALDDGVVGTASPGPVAVIHRPGGHLSRVGFGVRHAGHRHSHSGGAAAVRANGVGTVGLFGPGLVRLAEVSNGDGAPGEQLLAVFLQYLGEGRLGGRRQGFLRGQGELQLRRRRGRGGKLRPEVGRLLGGALDGLAGQVGGIEAEAANRVQSGASGVRHRGGCLPDRGDDTLIGFGGKVAAGRQFRRADAQHGQQHG